MIKAQWNTVILDGVIPRGTFYLLKANA